ncbi:C-type lectin domain-containing protein [Pyxidicoccus caerfyrddinensis]|uniref:C-type lectin domain-containing protein n=1 Tax=Pyxidicoccus caerfyrddinensis TaxID=2709663 RepID=UPI0013D9FE33|nr:C-type lectin domain-containing protein [Pyxidicoccus caerfyrddinensis]
MRGTRSAGLVPSRLLLAVAVTLWSACGGTAGPVSEDVDTASPLPEPAAQSASLSSTDLCAPAPGASVTSGDSVYYRYSTARTWAGAKADCAAMSGRLAVPMSSSGNEAIRSITGGALTYIGLSQLNGQTSTSAGWQTVEGDTPTWLGWASGEPNDGGGHPEYGIQNCARMYGDSGAWDDVKCANTSAYVCEFGSAPVTCGGGATCGMASGATTYRCQCPTGQRYDVELQSCIGGPLTIEVNSLNVDQAASGNVFVNFPLKARVGLKGTGSTNSFVVSLGLMQKPSGPNPTQAELESLQSCIVGGTRVTLTGDGTQQFVDIEGLVPPECLAGAPQRAANFFVLLDGADEFTTEENKWLVYNEKEAQTPVGQRCKTKDPVTGVERPGCVINVTVRPPPGTDVALLEATPDSSVVVLDSSTQPADVNAGAGEAPRPLFIAGLTVAAFGRDFDESGAASLPGMVDFVYDIVAQPDTGSVGWKRLNANPEALHAPIGTVKPGEELQFDARLHPTPEFRTLTNPGGPWAAATDFQVRACAQVPFPEHGDPMVAGQNGLANNCKVFSVRLVRGSHTSSLAASLDVTKTYSNAWGSSSTIQLALSGGSTNTFNLTGAYTDNEAKASIKGFFGSFDLAHAWGDASATVSPAVASMDTGFKVFGVSLLTYSKSAGSVTYTYDKSYAKEKCLTYTYGVVVASINISGCFSATAGFDMGVTASTTSISAQVRPYVNASLSVSGTLNLTLYKATLSASVTILGFNTSDSDGVTAKLYLVVNSTNPVKLTVAYDADAVFRISTLDGSIDLTIDQLEANWCKKKKWGISFYYVCWSYDTLAEYNLFSYDGYAFTSTLLDRSGSAITLQ